MLKTVCARLVGLLVWQSQAFAQVQGEGRPEIGQPAPAFSLPDSHGDRHPPRSQRQRRA